jgi:hypothetical protein
MDGQTTAARGGRAAYNTVKRSWFADLRGTVLEIGAGNGANFGPLPGQAELKLRTYVCAWNVTARHGTPWHPWITVPRH